ncbi:hypothetical protein RvY_07349-2 [Ramazzottius varieornatus]|uniref:RNA helicase n=1 Tax=Ramazzottius varieornatus TaxID=947166 RepID=A0A1D1V1U6_RAMVA|nr:hypothetical protein RvY_07349-2 [Ramazzottius varieornatus]
MDVDVADIPDDFGAMFVLGLPADEDQIRDIFAEVGTVTELKLLPQKDDKPTRAGVVTMASKAQALAAMETFKYKDLEQTGRRMKMSWDTRSLEKRQGGGGRREGGGGFGGFGGGVESSGFGGGSGSRFGGGGDQDGETATVGFGGGSSRFGGNGGSSSRFGASANYDGDSKPSGRFGGGGGRSRFGGGGNNEGGDSQPSGRFGGGGGYSRFGGGVGEDAGGQREEGGGGRFGGRGGNSDEAPRELRERRTGGGGDDAGGDGKQPATYVPPESGTRDARRAEHNTAGINFNRYANVPVEVNGDNIPKAISSYDTSSGLHPVILEAAAYMGYTTPTPIQKHCIPAILNKRDVMGCAQTGSGKTAGYLFPMISNLLHDGITGAEPSGRAQPQVLIVCPTRELALQVEKEASLYTETSGLKTFAVYGQTEMGFMKRRLYSGVNIIAATTGRLRMCLDNKYITLENLQYLVLDEADRMLDMGFSGDIEAIQICPSMPKDRVTLMFSATFPGEIQHMARRFMKDYIFMATGIVGGACGDVIQNVVQTGSRQDKKEALEELLRARAETNGGEVEKTLVFVETKEEADKIGLELGLNGISSTTIHGNRTQEQREMAIADFKSGRKAVLVATNVAARGLDIPNVKHVINWDLPRNADDMDEYVHRIGRTGRVGNKGLATTFYSSRNSAVAPKLVSIMEKSGHSPPEWLYQEAGMTKPEGDLPVRNGRTADFGARDVRPAADLRGRSPSPKPAGGASRFSGRAREEDDASSNGGAGDSAAVSECSSRFGGGSSRFGGGAKAEQSSGGGSRFGRGGGDAGASSEQLAETAGISRFGRRRFE